MLFGYSPQTAENVKDRLDADLGKVESRVRYLSSIVPKTGAITTKGETALEELRQMVSELQAVVDERTDPEAVA